MGQGGTPHTLQDQEGSWPEPLLYVLKQIPSSRRASAQALALTFWTLPFKIKDYYSSPLGPCF